MKFVEEIQLIFITIFCLPKNLRISTLKMFKLLLNYVEKNLANMEHDFSIFVNRRDQGN